MRILPAALACCAALIGLATTTDLRAETVKVTPELTVFTHDQARPAGERAPTVLRGSATKRGTVDGQSGEGYQPAEFQIGAGAKLWLADPESGRVIVCDERRTSRVGSRFVGCVEDQLPDVIYE
ncbi:MAG: hypothetical protein OEU92_29195 [Alphaproteobacteria bacterium]|nr:hypothetical protein [Alphaproteobacteria bacterium]